jgi:hypothetical protein
LLYRSRSYSSVRTKTKRWKPPRSLIRWKSTQEIYVFKPFYSLVLQNDPKFMSILLKNKRIAEVLRLPTTMLRNDSHALPVLSLYNGFFDSLIFKILNYVALTPHKSSQWIFLWILNFKVSVSHCFLFFK